MSRAATALIDLKALRHNLRLARESAVHRRVVAAIKANAYGHGLVRVARALDEADYFAVACIEEAMTLREAGITKPILLLEGVFEAKELPVCSRMKLDVVVHHSSQLEMLEQAKLDSPVRVWMKIDSGMHRLGLGPAQAKPVWQRLKACDSVAAGIWLMSHLANADDRTDGYTLEQLETFAAAIKGLPGDISLANSAATLGWSATHFDAVRPGIMLYGVSPFWDSSGLEEGLQPVMTLSTQLIAIKRLRKGDPIGYSGIWRCPEVMDVGVAAIGYGDGYPRQIETGTPVLLHGREASIVGRVSMDMLSVDLRRHPEARVGDPVLLWGPGLPVENIARAASTIPYTLLCGVTARVHFQETGSDEY